MNVNRIFICIMNVDRTFICIYQHSFAIVRVRVLCPSAVTRWVVVIEITGRLWLGCLSSLFWLIVVCFALYPLNNASVNHSASADFTCAEHVNLPGVQF